MREIIFRGKRTINGDWVYGDFMHGNERKSLRDSIFVYDSETQSFNDYEINPSTLGQYTGLTDKNGKRIFEGDIVQYYGTYPLEVYIEEGHTKIRWYDTISASKYDELFFTIDREGYGECEIIGNIHDNPELLKGGAV